MIRTIVKPESEQIALNIPKEYVGKEIEITYIPLNELHTTQPASFHKTMKDFWGTLSDDTAEKFHEYVKQSREEWEQNI